MKIQIIGYSGSGKSTFAKELSKYYQIPPTYIDTIAWEPGWVFASDEKILKEISIVINRKDWIIDGNYTRFLGEKRMRDADHIFFFNFNRFRCLFNAIKRQKMYKNKSRESMTNGCPERLNLEFVMWILFNGRTKRHHKNYQEIISTYKDKVTIFKNHKEVNKYLQRMLQK